MHVMVSTYAHNARIFIISVETIPTTRFIRPSILCVSLAAYALRHPPNTVLYFTVGVSGNIYDVQINNTETGRVYMRVYRCTNLIVQIRGNTHCFSMNPQCRDVIRYFFFFWKGRLQTPNKRPVISGFRLEWKPQNFAKRKLSGRSNYLRQGVVLSVFKGIHN